MMGNRLVFDLDGVVCDSKWRTRIAEDTNQLIKSSKKWDLFHSLCVYDKPIDFVVTELRFVSHSMFIHLLTGRTERYRKATEEWLKMYQIPYNHLHMRGDNDFRKASEFKSEVLNNIGIDNIVLFVDDLDHSADMAKNLGIHSILFDKNDFYTIKELQEFIDDIA